MQKKNLLEETFQKFHLQSLKHNVHIVSDGGSENKGEVDIWADNFKNNKVSKLTAKQNFPFSNSMIESLNNIFKNEFLKKILPKNIIHLKELLSEFYHYYNYNRFPASLWGYSPFEVLNGAIPDPSRFKSLINKAKKKRPLVNKSSSLHCLSCNSDYHRN